MMKNGVLRLQSNARPKAQGELNEDCSNNDKHANGVASPHDHAQRFNWNLDFEEAQAATMAIVDHLRDILISRGRPG